MAQGTPAGALQKQYLYLDGEPFAQVVLNDGIGVRLPTLPPGCSTAGGREDEVLFALAALCALTLAGRRRSRVGLLALVVLLSLGAPACTFDAGYLPGKGRGKKPRLKGADLKDPVYFFHNDRLGTPQRLTSETGATVWRGEFRPFGDIFRIEEDVDQNGVAVENNLRFPGMYDEALSSTLFQTGPYQNHHRWYSPDLGRYLSSEPLLLRSGYPTWSARRGRPTASFSYALSDPTKFIDQTGLAPEQAFDTPEQAATDVFRWLEKTYPADFPVFEWAGSIYQKEVDGKTKWFATQPNTNYNQIWVEPSRPANNCPPVFTYHNHPTWPAPMSTQDLKLQNKWGTKGTYIYYPLNYLQDPWVLYWTSPFIPGETVTFRSALWYP